MMLAEDVKRLRLERGLSQEAFAHFLGVTLQSVSCWERGITRITPERELWIKTKLGLDAERS